MGAADAALAARRPDERVRASRELLADLAGDDRAAERARAALVALWAPDVLRWCRLLSDARVQPEDACQDVLVALMDGAGRLRDPARLRSWLWTLAWRTVRAHRRRAWVRRWVPGPAALDAAPAPLPPEDLAVKRALESLPDADRRLLWLAYAEGATREEIGQHLGWPEGTVNRRLASARRAFAAAARRQGLDDGGDDVG